MNGSILVSMEKVWLFRSCDLNLPMLVLFCHGVLIQPHDKTWDCVETRMRPKRIRNAPQTFSPFTQYFFKRLNLIELTPPSIYPQILLKS
jgi:hypothetical protein